MNNVSVLKESIVSRLQSTPSLMVPSITAKSFFYVPGMETPNIVLLSTLFITDVYL
jgi:hypothetical protein